MYDKFIKTGGGTMEDHSDEVIAAALNVLLDVVMIHGEMDGISTRTMKDGTTLRFHVQIHDADECGATQAHSAPTPGESVQ